MPRFVCPRCRGALASSAPNILRCKQDRLDFPRRDGIWRFLLPERAAHFSRFMDDYAGVRRQEGRGSNDPAYYRALPFRDLTGKRAGEWRIRAAGFEALIRHVLAPLEPSRPLRILDLGAGNGWFSARLAARGHVVTAVDLQVNSDDGLGAFVHYPAVYTPVQAEFDRLPFAPRQFDLAVFNAAFHYSENYTTTLSSAVDAVAESGGVVILDTPIYRDGNSGAAMVRERHEQFARAFGTRSDALRSENYLTCRRIRELAATLDLEVQTYRPRHPLPWRLKPWLARLKGSREPAAFNLVVYSRRPPSAAQSS
jgi:SAM-dependent methyltransferase